MNYTIENHIATVRNDDGDKLAEFHGAHCAQDAQLFIDAFAARDGLLRMGASIAWSMGRSADRWVLSFWVRGKKFEATQDGATNALDAIARLVAKTDRLIEQAKEVA